MGIGSRLGSIDVELELTARLLGVIAVDNQTVITACRSFCRDSPNSAGSSIGGPLRFNIYVTSNMGRDPLEYAAKDRNSGEWYINIVSKHRQIMRITID